MHPIERELAESMGLSEYLSSIENAAVEWAVGTVQAITSIRLIMLAGDFAVEQAIKYIDALGPAEDTAEHAEAIMAACLRFNYPGPPLRDALARIRLGRGMTTSQMAQALGLSPSQLSRVEHGRSVQLDPPPDILAQLAERGFASDEGYRTAIVATRVSVPEGFAASLDQALGLSPEERATLDAALSGDPLDPPYPTEAEMVRMRELIKRRPE